MNRVLIVAALVGAITPIAARSQRSGTGALPIAIVTEVRGQASVDSPDQAKRDVRLFDWFAADARLTTGPASSITVVFQNGMRSRLGERSQFRVTADGPADTKGTVHALSPVPPLPQVSTVRLEGPATRINAVRVRAEAFSKLHPDGAVLADAVRLEFEPEQPFSAYAISIEREDGSIVFEKTASATTVDVPAGVLTPGARYYWHVQAEDTLGRRVRGSARFETLTREQSARRQALREHLATSHEAAFLAEIDRSLGLSR